jgi:hypothetical protein
VCVLKIYIPIECVHVVCCMFYQLIKICLFGVPLKWRCGFVCGERAKISAENYENEIDTLAVSVMWVCERKFRDDWFCWGGKLHRSSIFEMSSCS